MVGTRLISENNTVSIEVTAFVIGRDKVDQATQGGLQNRFTPGRHDYLVEFVDLSDSTRSGCVAFRHHWFSRPIHMHRERCP